MAKKLKCWKKVRDRKVGNNISIIYSKNGKSLELFRDSMWGKTDNMNVIVRDFKQKSFESALGKDILVKHMGTKTQATKFAESYMTKHGGLCKL